MVEMENFLKMAAQGLEYLIRVVKTNLGCKTDRKIRITYTGFDGFNLILWTLDHHFWEIQSFLGFSDQSYDTAGPKMWHNIQKIIQDVYDKYL